jgi:hypothetical protein
MKVFTLFVICNINYITTKFVYSSIKHPSRVVRIPTSYFGYTVSKFLLMISVDVNNQTFLQRHQINHKNVSTKQVCAAATSFFRIWELCLNLRRGATNLKNVSWCRPVKFSGIFPYSSLLHLPSLSFRRLFPLAYSGLQLTMTLWILNHIKQSQSQSESVRVTLRLTVSQSVSLGVEPLLGPMTRF